MKLNWAERWVVNNPLRVIEQGIYPKKLARAMPLDPGSCCLEIGCGRGAAAIGIPAQAPAPHEQGPREQVLAHGGEEVRLSRAAVDAGWRPYSQQVGQTETLILHIGESDDPETLANSLKGLQDILEANVTDHEISIITPEAEDILAPVISKANECGVKVRSVDMREPNLEAVFLHLTGRALRDE